MAPASYDESDSEREELLDQHVAYFLQQNPDVHAQHRIQKIRPCVYNVDGREINVEWHYPDDPAQSGHLIAIDGPLRQPFSEYMKGSEINAQYDNQQLKRSALQQVSKGRRMSFGDEHKMYTRLEAMKVAKEQALVREQAAGYAKDGMYVPEHELMTKYNKVLSQKLGNNRQRRPDPTPAPAAAPTPRAQAAPAAMAAPAAAPAAAAVAAPAAAPATKPAKAAGPSQSKQQLTHGSPCYCADHDKTEKRKKTKPRKEECSKCRTLIQTNYVEFALCPACSEKDNLCMCCGKPASTPSAVQEVADKSMPNIFGSLGLQNLAPLKAPQNLLGGAVGFMNSAFQAQSVKQAPPFKSQNAGATQNYMASQNVMSSCNAMASQNVFASQNPMVSQNIFASQNVRTARA